MMTNPTGRITQGQFPSLPHPWPPGASPRVGTVADAVVTRGHRLEVGVGDDARFGPFGAACAGVRRFRGGGARR